MSEFNSDDHYIYYWGQESLQRNWVALRVLVPGKSMDLTFQVPTQYCCLQHRTLLLSPATSTTGYCFCFGSIPSFFLELFLHWSPVVYRTPTDLGNSFQYPIILPFYTVHEVLKARILKWFAIPFSSGPHSVRPLHHDLSILGGPTGHGLVSFC